MSDASKVSPYEGQHEPRLQERIVVSEPLIARSLLNVGAQFFSLEQAGIVDAIADRLIPGDLRNPGAREAGAVVYIDRTLAGYFSSLQTLYREGLESVDQLAIALLGKGFAALAPEQQDEVLRVVENPEHPKGSVKLAQFFAVVREHTIEGTFGDPIYGGNRDAAGWKMIGFPGAQWGYSAKQMASGMDATRIPPATLADVQRRSSAKVGG